MKKTNDRTETIASNIRNTAQLAAIFAEWSANARATAANMEKAYEAFTAIANRLAEIDELADELNA